MRAERRWWFRVWSSILASGALLIFDSMRLAVDSGILVGTGNRALRNSVVMKIREPQEVPILRTCRQTLLISCMRISICAVPTGLGTFPIFLPRTYVLG